jgi:hypothetical protein
VEKEEYEKQRPALGLDDEVKMWLEQHQMVAIRRNEPIHLALFFLFLLGMNMYMLSCACLLL